MIRRRDLQPDEEHPPIIGAPVGMCDDPGRHEPHAEEGKDGLVLCPGRQTPTRKQVDIAAFVAAQHDDEPTGRCEICGVLRCAVRRAALDVIKAGIDAKVI